VKVIPIICGHLLVELAITHTQAKHIYIFNNLYLFSAGLMLRCLINTSVLNTLSVVAK